MQLLRKALSQFTWLDQQQIYLILEQFFSSSEKLFFQVQVRQNNRVISSSSLSSQPW